MTHRDYLDDAKAPQASSIVVAVSAFVTNDAGQVLMIRRSDNNLHPTGGPLETGP